MSKIMFICAANVARSQMAEGYYNHLTKSKDAISAGVYDFTDRYLYLPGDVVGLMYEHGINVSMRRPKVVTEQMVSDIEKIIILCEKQKCPDFLVNSGKNTYWDITDPCNMGIDKMRKIRDQIKAKVEELVQSPSQVA
ncbi:hypothetical protein KY317_01535 [Candidatus Woesearchaeota archaeon]|nr:hypothetical protein [Candidatus Woesearchaeota archaeon]